MSDRRESEGNDETSQNPAFVYLGSLGEGSRRSMRQALARVVLISLGEEVPELGRGEAARFQDEVIGAFDWHLLTPDKVGFIREALAQYVVAGTLNAKTANKMLAALTGTIKEAWRLGAMDAEKRERLLDFKAIAAPVSTQVGVTQRSPRRLTSEELLALADACRLDHSATGVRDMAIIAVAYFGGLGRSELVELMRSDYEPDVDMLTINGARNRVRSTPIPLAWDELRVWLAIRGDEEGPLFTRIIKGGTVHLIALTPQAITYILAKRGKDAGLRPFSLRDMRNTFIDNLLNSGVDLSTVSAMVGHASVQTTLRYTRIRTQHKVSAVQGLVKPW